MPDVSVIIPTRNRAESLRRTLEALAHQTLQPSNFEVIAAPNDCSDDTAAMVRALATPYHLRMIESPVAGTALARNSGALIARGNVLVFLDDDIQPQPGFLAAHALCHEQSPNVVAQGHLLPPLDVGTDLFARRLRDFDLALAAAQAQTGGVSWRHLSGGNVSVPKRLFEQIGGFDASIGAYGGEDYEFGYRAQRNGAHLVFLDDASGYSYRYENTSVALYLRKLRSVGRVDTGVVRKHPEMAGHLRIGLVMQPQTKLGRLARVFAFDHQILGDAMAGVLLLGGGVLARLRLRRQWNRLMDCLDQYWYFRGVADGIGNRAAVAACFADLRRASAECEPPSPAPGA
jgi:glycosyltransferase involved in cell wall biosynthesis